MTHVKVKLENLIHFIKDNLFDIFIFATGKTKLNMNFPPISNSTPEYYSRNYGRYRHLGISSSESSNKNSKFISLASYFYISQHSR